MSEQEQASFSGWAILEIFGHQKYAGMVTSQVFGTSVMLRLDVPGLQERERVAGSYEYDHDGRAIPAGSVVKVEASPPYTKFFGVGAIYSMTPCTEEAALKALESLQPRPIQVVSLPRQQHFLESDAENDEALKYRSSSMKKDIFWVRPSGMRCYRIFVEDVGPGRFSCSGFGDIIASSPDDAIQKTSKSWKWQGNRRFLALPHTRKDLWPDGKTGEVPAEAYLFRP